MKIYRTPWLTNHSLIFNDDLPITAHIEQIKQALSTHQVIVVAGETGSGKTTQLPKVALALGRGTNGLIGHTQPRRIAARSLAQRLAEELKVELGGLVGYQIRFQQKLHETTYVKIMTDGILLAELAYDPLLKKYDTLIIDEAHERSLNIDFIFGCLKKILPKRPDLKIIITSATLDHQRFTKYFHNCPLIEVSGRGYPIEIRYAEIDVQDDEGSTKQRAKAILKAIETLPEEGDILVFLSGERDIRVTAEFLKQAHLRRSEILPLYAKLNTNEQQKIFQSSAWRKIILATNVAETSLTIPNIYYVIDTGLARIKRYNYRSKIQRLLIESISQASANQRAGRCGRVAPGVCIRLYSEEDFLKRESFTQPEILRSNLSSVILQILFLNLGEAENFLWMDAPESSHWKDAYQNLIELGAIERNSANAWQLTAVGKLLARLPVDPRLGRMLVAAHKNACLQEVLVMVSAMSVGEILQRPLDNQQAADAKQAQFKNSTSDFLTYLNVWIVLQKQRQSLTNKQFKKFCDEHYIAYNKWLEWQDMYAELKETLSVMHIKLREDRLETRCTEKVKDLTEEQQKKIHLSLLSGLLNHIGHKDEQGVFMGTRQRQFKIFPGSVIAKKPPVWIMALEIVETQKVFARTCAIIDPQWVETLASPLVKKTYFSPHFDAKRGDVLVFEKVLFNGLVIIEKRKVCYAPIDAQASHHIFLREALAQRHLSSQLSFWQHNEKFLKNLENIEERTRRRDLLPDEEWLYQFYHTKIPATIHNQQDLEKWFKSLDVDAKNALILSEALLNAGVKKNVEAYPTQWEFQGNQLRISYQFSPGSAEDGLSLWVPESLLPQLSPEPFDWLVPGLLKEKVLAILKALPKNFRMMLGNPLEAAEFFYAEMSSGEGNFFATLAKLLQEHYQLTLPKQTLADLVIPEHLKLNFKIFSNDKIIASGRNLLALQHHLLGREQKSETNKTGSMGHDSISLESLGGTLQQEAPFSLNANFLSISPISSFDFVTENHIKLKKYLALQANGQSTKLIYENNECVAQATHRLGILKLLQLHMPRACRDISQKYFILTLLQVTNQRSLNKAWQFYTHDLNEWENFQQSLLDLIFAITFADDFWLIRSEQEFLACFNANQQDLFTNVALVVEWLLSFLKQLSQLNQELAKTHEGALKEFIQQQKNHLLAAGFAAVVPWEWLERYPAYLAAFRQALSPATKEKALKALSGLVSLNQLYAQQKKNIGQQFHLFNEENRLISKEPEIFFNANFCVSTELTESFFLLQEYQMVTLAPQMKPAVSVSEVRMKQLLTSK